MEDRKLTERESLDVITQMIARTKASTIGSGRIFLFWGYLVTIVPLAVWALLVATHNQNWNWLWFAIPAVGGIVTPMLVRKEHREYRVTTYYDRIVSSLWTIFSLTEMVMILICLGLGLCEQINSWSAIMALTLILAPACEIMHGLLIKEKCIVGGGMTGLLAGLVTLSCIAGGIPLGINWFMPLFIFAFVAMMVVPGHILYHKEQNK